MSSERTLEVRPIPGWQWSDTDPKTAWDYVPPPFHAELMPEVRVWNDQEERTLTGRIAEPSHPLDGYTVLLSQRHVDWDGHVNVSLRSTERELKGFGLIDLDSFDG